MYKTPNFLGTGTRKVKGTVRAYLDANEGMKTGMVGSKGRIVNVVVGLQQLEGRTSLRAD